MTWLRPAIHKYVFLINHSVYNLSPQAIRHLNAKEALGNY